MFICFIKYKKIGFIHLYWNSHWLLLRRKSYDSYLLLDWWVFANPNRLINRSVFLYFDAQESSACSVYTLLTDQCDEMI